MRIAISPNSLARFKRRRKAQAAEKLLGHASHAINRASNDINQRQFEGAIQKRQYPERALNNS